LIVVIAVWIATAFVFKLVEMYDGCGCCCSNTCVPTQTRQREDANVTKAVDNEKALAHQVSVSKTQLQHLQPSAAVATAFSPVEADESEGRVGLALAQCCDRRRYAFSSTSISLPTAYLQRIDILPDQQSLTERASFCSWLMDVRPRRAVQMYFSADFMSTHLYLGVW
jgi:hypothetical protein